MSIPIEPLQPFGKAKVIKKERCCKRFCAFSYLAAYVLVFQVLALLLYMFGARFLIVVYENCPTRSAGQLYGFQ